MQTTSATMLTALSAHTAAGGSFSLAEVVEIYASDYVPGVNGFDPADAEALFGGIAGFTWLGETYAREFGDRNDIQRYFDKTENSVSANFSNVSRAFAAYLQANEVEGKWLVVRCIASTSTVLADSVVLICARVDKPGDVDDVSGSLTATQRFGQINQQFPPRTYGPNDPKGRAPSDPLFEGFRFTPVSGSLQYTTRERRQGFGSLLGLTKKITHSLQYSSHANFESEMPVADAFGRVSLPHVYIGTIDIGGAINFLVAFCEGPIAEYENLRQVNPKFSQFQGGPPALRYGYLGGQGPVGRVQQPVYVDRPDLIGKIPGDGYYSRTAWAAGSVIGSTPDVDEAEAPDFAAVLKAKIVKVPDGSGAFALETWSDSPAAIARFLLASDRYFNEGEAAMEDAVNYDTYLHGKEYVLDESQGERAFLNEADEPFHGSLFTLYRSTGLVDSRRVRMAEIGDLAGDPYLLPADPEPYDPTDPPATFTPKTYLRERYTCNVTLTERVTATDFLHNTVAPTGRLYFVRNGKGRIEIRSERPADNTRLRSALAAGVSAVPVLDVEPWRASLSQRLLVGAHLLTSEVRDVIAAGYTADGNSITLSASKTGGVTATASGATLSGGSSSAAASATVTIGGTPAAGDTVTVTIGGIAVVLTVDADPTTASVAALLARLIHATPKLRQFVKATWGGANVVTIAARYGVLTLSSQLANTHTGQVANPTAAPGLSASGGGALSAGTWRVGYTYVTASGETALSPTASVTVTANQKIDTASLLPLPAGVTAVKWYVSTGPGSTELVYYSQTSGGAGSLGTFAAPDSTQALAPSLNTTGEELIRVAASYAANDQGAAVLAQAGLTKGNIHASPPIKWPLGGKQTSINQVGGTFYDAKDDFSPTPLEVHDFAHQARVRKVNKKDVDLSGFDNYHQASRYCNFILSKNREGDFFVQFQTGPLGMLHEEGDVICVSFGNGGFVNLPVRIEEISIGKAPTYNTRIVGRRYSTTMYSDDVRQHTIKMPTTLYAAGSAPLAPTGLALTEHSVTATSATLHGEFAFTPYVAKQTGRVLLKRDGDTEFRDTGLVVSEDEDGNGYFDIPGLPPGDHEVKIQPEVRGRVGTQTAAEPVTTTTAGSIEVDEFIVGDELSFADEAAREASRQNMRAADETRAYMGF